MIQENQKSLIRLHIVLDAVMAAVAFGLAYFVRFYTTLLSEGNSVLSMYETLIPLVLGIPALLLLYNLFELYDISRSFGKYDIFTRVFKANILSGLLVLAVLFIFKINDFSRWTLAMFFALDVCLTAGTRILVRRSLRKRFTEGKHLRNTLILGYNDIAEELIRRLMETQASGYQIVGILDDYVNVGKRLHSALVLGKVTDLEHKLQVFDIDVVIIALPASEYDEKLGAILHICERTGVKSQIVPYYYRYIPARAYMDDLNGLPIIDTRHVPLDNFVKASLKRIFDIVFSIFALVLTSPILIVSAILIKLTSPGPIFFKQTRVGLNRKSFDMYKFRSMVVQAPAQERTEWTKPGDPRRTRWGEIMRKTSIDELPQFFNVLAGDMSVVGPRPERPYFVEQFKESIPNYMIKHQVRPGITGWAQINGWRGDTSIEKRIEFDLYYIENWTFALDLKIIILTVFKGLNDKNAY